MKFYDSGIVVLIIIFSLCLLAGATSTLFLENDNVIEETAENIIKEKTGVDVDLTPSTPENN